MTDAQREFVQVTAALLWVAFMVWLLHAEALWWVAKG